MNQKPYSTPEAFKQALEAQIRRAAPTNIGRFRQVLVFDRFLARVHQHFGDRVIVKGGVVLELRLAQARATKDVDLRLTGDSKQVLADLQAAGRRDLGEWISFEIVADRDQPAMQGDGLVYAGYRYRAQGRLAGKIYASAFGVDVAFADAMTEKPEVIPGSDFLSFAGVDPTPLRVYPRVTHVAEKLHAYTLPRVRENSRVKDLPDIALLASLGPIGAAELRTAIGATFAFRGTHPVPDMLPTPPGSWATPYARMARLNGLPWANLGELERAVRVFLDPLLGAAAGSVWSPALARWQ